MLQSVLEQYALLFTAIHFERLTGSVVAFVVTVDLIALRGKMTDVARREWQRSFVPRQNIVIPA